MSGDEIRADRLQGLLGPYIGNPNIQRAGKREDRFSGPALALLSGLLGTAPDEQGGSVLDPNSARNSPNAAGSGFGLGLLAQTSPIVNRLAGLLGSRQNTSSLARHAGKIDAPPSRQLRPFSDDYPSTGAGANSGQLAFDIEGRPLSARYIAGRRVVGGHDASLGPEEIEDIAGRLGAAVKESNSIGSDLGRYVAGRGKDGEALREILLSPKITAQQLTHVFAHETGHLIDDIGFGRMMPKNGVSRDLSQVYSDLESRRLDLKLVAATP